MSPFNIHDRKGGIIDKQKYRSKTINTTHNDQKPILTSESQFSVLFSIHK